LDNLYEKGELLLVIHCKMVCRKEPHRRRMGHHRRRMGHHRRRREHHRKMMGHRRKMMGQRKREPHKKMRELSRNCLCHHHHQLELGLISKL